MKFLLGIIFLLLCSTVIYAQSSNDRVIMLPLRIQAPAIAKKIGTIKAGNNATETHCDYEQMVKEVKDKARAMGGNIVKITKLAEPAFISKCYRIEADVYYISELPANLIPKTNDAITSISGKQDHAVLYIYRLKDTVAFASSYHLHLNNDSVICTVKSKSRDSVSIYKEGLVTLWAETEKKAELKLNIQFGKVYYIRCGLQGGEIRMVPKMEIVDKAEGEKEYGSQRKSKKNMNVAYLQQIH